MANWATGERITAARLNNPEIQSLIVNGQVKIRFPGAGNKWTVQETTMADDGELSTAFLLDGGSNGTLWIASNTSGDVYGAVVIRGGLNSVTEIYDVFGTIATVDADGHLCVIAAGGGTYLIKNRRGSTQSFALMFMGS